MPGSIGDTSSDAEGDPPMGSILLRGKPVEEVPRRVHWRDDPSHPKSALLRIDTRLREISHENNAPQSNEWTPIDSPDDHEFPYAFAWSEVPGPDDGHKRELAEYTSSVPHAAVTGEQAQWQRTPFIQPFDLPGSPISPMFPLPSPLLKAAYEPLADDAQASCGTSLALQDTSDDLSDEHASQPALSNSPCPNGPLDSSSAVLGDVSSAENEEDVQRGLQHAHEDITGGLGLRHHGVLSASWSAETPLCDSKAYRAEQDSIRSPSSPRKVPRMRSLCNIRGSPSRPRSPLSPKSQYPRVYTPRLPFGPSIQNTHSSSMTSPNCAASPVLASSPVFAASPVFDSPSFAAVTPQAVDLADEMQALYLDGVCASPTLF
ncbi:hypothetical protein BD626DRAFT_568590 [Schizophyllum amplum]|uniref:Uncharacterized protein n=1 Tax=Schizophyllum amplum TaxID=97359 RepID=A0A550CH09_9AGAR|nr:hypothetical protein BD626DRAFT_568590 [Auriculariopsis ampla]